MSLQATSIAQMEDSVGRALTQEKERRTSYYPFVAFTNARKETCGPTSYYLDKK
jgi:hypothetical protein